MSTEGPRRRRPPESDEEEDERPPPSDEEEERRLLSSSSALKKKKQGSKQSDADLREGEDSDVAYESSPLLHEDPTGHFRPGSSRPSAGTRPSAAAAEVDQPPPPLAADARFLNKRRSALGVQRLASTSPDDSLDEDRSTNALIADFARAKVIQAVGGFDDVLQRDIDIATALPDILPGPTPNLIKRDMAFLYAAEERQSVVGRAQRVAGAWATATYVPTVLPYVAAYVVPGIF